MRRSPRRSARPSAARRSRGPARCSAATASSSTTTSARFFADCRGALLLRRHVPDAKPDRRQGDHRAQRLRVTSPTGRHRCRLTSQTGSINMSNSNSCAVTPTRVLANASADACECPVREEGRDRLCDAQPAQGAQRPEPGDMAGPARPPSRMRRTTPPCAASS